MGRVARSAGGGLRICLRKSPHNAGTVGFQPPSGERVIVPDPNAGTQERRGFEQNALLAEKYTFMSKVAPQLLQGRHVSDNDVEHFAAHFRIEKVDPNDPIKVSEFVRSYQDIYVRKPDKWDSALKDIQKAYQVEGTDLDVAKALGHIIFENPVRYLTLYHSESMNEERRNTARACSSRR
jgi:hypothetical protein